MTIMLEHLRAATEDNPVQFYAVAQNPNRYSLYLMLDGRLQRVTPARLDDGPVDGAHARVSKLCKRLGWRARYMAYVADGGGYDKSHDVAYRIMMHVLGISAKALRSFRVEVLA